MQKPTYKLILCATLSAAALTLGACADKGSKTSEDDPTYDAQTEIEQEATGVNDVEQATEGDSAVVSDDVVVASSDDMENMSKDEQAVMMKNDVVIDDSEILDGTESQEHVSTY